MRLLNQSEIAMLRRLTEVERETALGLARLSGLDRSEILRACRGMEKWKWVSRRRWEMPDGEMYSWRITKRGRMALEATLAAGEVVEEAKSRRLRKLGVN